MSFSSLTNQVQSSTQRSSRGGVAIDTFLIHHQASTDDDATIREMVTGSRQVSANYTIDSNGRITGVVDEEDRAWTSGSEYDGGKGAAWDCRSITVEIANSAGAPDWPISQEAINAAAELLIDLQKRYGIKNILGHRDLWLQFQASYPTYCPGPEKVAEITARATQLANGSAVFTPYAGGSAPVSYPTVWNGYDVATIQRLLTTAGFPTTADGLYGPDTAAKVTAFQAAHGLAQDGNVGPITWAALNGAAPGVAVAAAPTGAQLTVDGAEGPLTDKALQAALGVTQDGIIGPITIEALQRKLGVTADGILGPITTKALQSHLGVTADGIWGAQTTTALQVRLNAGTF